MPGELSSFTPFGYLRNPAHRATSWQATRGGNLRAATDCLGVEWVYPVGRDAATRAALGLETTVDGRTCRTRADFDAIGLTCGHHSCLMLGFEWQVHGVRVEGRFYLAGEDALCLRLIAVNRSAKRRHLSLEVVGHIDAGSPGVHVVTGAQPAELLLEPGQAIHLVAALARGPDEQAAHETGHLALSQAEATFERVLAEDQRFSAGCPSLSGDWPAHWREGLHIDFETTRLLVQPPGGIFTDVWPSWMVAWPRVVLAEGTLDMLRLAYADPSLAQRAVSSMFRDAPYPNVPCVFESGAFNMLAADGSRCGTSPAWCLPFLNLELLYLSTLDRDWLGQLYPYAAAYLEWWLEHRVDAEGWAVYKCTWEAGEDGNPRLDPTGSGDADISRRIRPVELQATLAHAAGVLAFFAAQLGRDPTRWRAIEADYRARTRRLFDPQAGRFRDWLIAEDRFQSPNPESLYWGVDACRYSAQSLTPMLIGEALPEQEVWRHACPPWTLWPSWTWSLVESAAAAGLYARVGELAFQAIDRVYRVTTRRDTGSLVRPLPGASPEFWPEDWRTYAGNDGYGWGATTANLLIRHLFGFKASRQTDGWVAELTPALPACLLSPGSRYTIRGLSYRGLVFDLSYAVVPDGLRAELELPDDQPRECSVLQPGELTFASRQAASQHQFKVPLGAAVTLRLR